MVEDSVLHGSDDYSELELKIAGRIHSVLTRHPGSSISSLNTHVRPYGVEWRKVLGRLVDRGHIRREIAELEGTIFERFYTNKPVGEVTVTIHSTV